uniref:Uncharacterized protein n=1 Tax=Anguilla anguilla TaxID=7936 RepID=A0A0E9S6H0_ANGAN
MHLCQYNRTTLYCISLCIFIEKDLHLLETLPLPG